MKKILLSFLLAASLSSIAQRKKQPETVPTPPTNATVSPIEGKTAWMNKFPGFFEFFYDEKQDKIFLVIDKFDSEFLYVTSLTAGVGSNDIGLDRNRLGQERVVKFERRGPKVLLTEINLGFRAISNNAAERKAVQEAFAQSVLWGFTVTAEEAGKVLVDASDFFLQDAFDVVGTLRNTQQGTYALDKSRSALFLPRTKNFPQNTELEAMNTLSKAAILSSYALLRSIFPLVSFTNGCG